MARTPKEVSFNKGDIIQIFSRTNSDWWDARVDGQFGFVPVPYIRLIERPVSVSESGTENRRHRKTTAEGEDAAKRSAVGTPPPSPRVQEGGIIETELKSSSGSDVTSPSEQHTGNVFMHIDPTVGTGSHSPLSVRRSGSERAGASGQRTNVPSRSLSDKSFTTRKYQSRQPNLPPCDSQELEQLESTVSAVSHAFLSGAGKVLPGAMGLHVSQQDLQESKVRANTEPVLSDPETTTFPRAVGKDKSKMVPARPVSAFGRTTNVPEPIPDNVPSFKPPPPPTALKPKPVVRKKDELLVSLHAAAYAKSNRKNHDGKDVTHL